MHQSFVAQVAGVVACALVCCAVPAAAKTAKSSKKDTTPPTLDHVPVPHHDGKGPLLIEAKIVDDKSGIFEPTLLVRAAGTTDYQRIPMAPRLGAPDVFVAEVPAALLAGDVDYILEAFDQAGNGPSRVGDEATPLKITRDAPATVATPPPPPPPPPSVPEDAGPSGVVIGAGVAVGAVVLVGAVVGGGFLYYALRPPAVSTVTIQVTGPSPLPGAG